MSIKAALAGMKDNFANSTAVYEQFFEKLPVGTYNALLLQCFCKLNEESGNVRINRGWLILDGAYEGKKAFDGINVGGEYGPAFVRRFIEQCNYVFDENDPEQIEDTCMAIQDEQLCFSIKVTHKDDFLNINIQKQIPNPNGDSAPAAEEDAAPEGDAPAAEEGEADTEEFLENVRQFALGQGLDGVTDSSDLDELKGIMSGYTFNPEELDQTEIDLVTACGLKHRLVIPAPEKPAAPVPKAAPAKAPAKAAPAPVAKAPVKAPAPAGKVPAKAAPAAPAKKGPQKAR